MSKIYRGDRTIDGITVTVDGRPLPERTDIKPICEDGFEWSYEGTAPSQLALAILADHTGNSQLALKLCDPFMKHIVANFNNEWEMTSEDVEAAIVALGGVR
ncbi:MAG: DUF6166 domain-containing protein [Rhodomicrobium sp.]